MLKDEWIEEQTHAPFVLSGHRRLADAAYKFEALPKIPLHYLFWKGDEEFNPRLSVLFDRSIEYHLAADIIWGLVTLVSDAILSVPSSSSAEKAC